MFVELMPLLASRTVLITVAKVDDVTLRVNVIPPLSRRFHQSRNGGDPRAPHRPKVLEKHQESEQAQFAATFTYGRMHTLLWRGAILWPGKA